MFKPYLILHCYFIHCPLRYIELPNLLMSRRAKVCRSVQLCILHRNNAVKWTTARSKAQTKSHTSWSSDGSTTLHIVHVVKEAVGVRKARCNWPQTSWLGPKAENGKETATLQWLPQVRLGPGPQRTPKVEPSKIVGTWFLQVVCSILSCNHEQTDHISKETAAILTPLSRRRRTV